MGIVGKPCIKWGLSSSSVRQSKHVASVSCFLKVTIGLTWVSLPVRCDKFIVCSSIVPHTLKFSVYKKKHYNFFHNLELRWLFPRRNHCSYRLYICNTEKRRISSIHFHYIIFSWILFSSRKTSKCDIANYLMFYSIMYKRKLCNQQKQCFDCQCDDDEDWIFEVSNRTLA